MHQADSGSEERQVDVVSRINDYCMHSQSKKSFYMEHKFASSLPVRQINAVDLVALSLELGKRNKDNEPKTF